MGMAHMVMCFVKRIFPLDDADAKATDRVLEVEAVQDPFRLFGHFWHPAHHPLPFSLLLVDRWQVVRGRQVGIGVVGVVHSLLRRGWFPTGHGSRHD